jgi:DNA replication protein DnaC
MQKPTYDQYSERREMSHEISLPDEAQCPVCHYFDAGHPDVQRILKRREKEEHFASGFLLAAAGCQCRDVEAKRQRDTEMRWAQANLPHPHSPHTLAQLRDMEAVLPDLQRFLQGDGPRCLLLQGQTGSGKSHILEGLGRAMLENGHTVRYDTASAFLDRLRHTFTDDQDSVGGVVAWYHGRRLVLLDDLGTRAERDWAIQEITEVVDARIRMGWHLAVATNLSRDEMAEALGDRLASRLYQDNPELGEVRRITLTAQDYRRV